MSNETARWWSFKPRGESFVCGFGCYDAASIFAKWLLCNSNPVDGPMFGELNVGSLHAVLNRCFVRDYEGELWADLGAIPGINAKVECRHSPGHPRQFYVSRAE